MREKESLIKKLEALPGVVDSGTRMFSWIERSKATAIAIVSQHGVDQPQDEVERVTLAIHSVDEHMDFNNDYFTDGYRDTTRQKAKAAIAAMGDAHYSGSIERESYVAPETVSPAISLSASKVTVEPDIAVRYWGGNIRGWYKPAQREDFDFANQGYWGKPSVSAMKETEGAKRTSGDPKDDPFMGSGC